MYSSEPKERLILWNTEPTSNPPSDHYFVWIKDGKFYTLDHQGVQKEYATIEELSAKVNTSDIVDNLTSEDVDKPLSANQGKQLNDDKASLSGAEFEGDISALSGDFENGVSNRSIPRTNDDGLVGLWRFENSVYDPIGDRSFSISGSPAYQEGVHKSAIEFDGDNWLSTDTDLFDTSNDYSISFKFQHQEQVNSSPRVINYGGRGWGIFTNGNNYFLITYDENEDASFNTIIESPNEGQWYDIVVEFDSSLETYYVYVDSNLEATRTRTVRIEDNEFRCARGKHGGTEWVGRIDELRFYDKRISEETRNVLYRYPSGNIGGLISGNNIEGGIPEIDGMKIDGRSISNRYKLEVVVDSGGDVGDGVQLNVGSHGDGLYVYNRFANENLAFVGHDSNGSTGSLRLKRTTGDENVIIRANGDSKIHGSTLDFSTMPTVDGNPVVESGSNSDGRWTRWADGTQICFARLRLTGLDSSNEHDDWTLPISFADSDYIYHAMLVNPGFGEGVKLAYPWPSSFQSTTVCRFRSTSDMSSRDLYLTAIGRWY